MEDFNYSESEMPCKKHPYSSPVGICAHCLRDRLVKLVCSDCGEQRLSSCSCSDVSSSYRNSCSMMEIGSVGRVSFLLENEKIENPQLTNRNPNPNTRGEQVIYLKRSNSSCVEVKKSNGFWRIKRFFRKKRSKGFENNGGISVSDERSEIWVSDIVGVSRSRSLCSFRGDYDGFSSSAKISDVTSGIFFNESEPRISGFKNVFDSRRGSIDRPYGVAKRNVFPSRESDFSAMDESAFIDLKLDSESSESKHDIVNGRVSGASDHGVGLKSESFENLASLRNNGGFGNGDCCRITVNEKGLRRSKSHKVWKWIFRYNPVNKEKITS